MSMVTFKECTMARFCWTVTAMVLLTSLQAGLCEASLVSSLPTDRNSPRSNEEVKHEMPIIRALYESLSDPNGLLDSWDMSLANACGFNHIECNAENSVIRIDLVSGGLSGQLVPQLGYLSNLQYLDVANNNLSGPLPDELGSLQHLISLQIFDNQFSGSIPASFGNLSALSIFQAQRNFLSGTIPVSLTNVATLQALDLSYNELTGEVPNNGSFSSLTLASFEGNTGLCGTLIDVSCTGEAPSSSPLKYTTDSSSSCSRLETNKLDAWLWITLMVTLHFNFFYHNIHKSMAGAFT